MACLQKYKFVSIVGGVGVTFIFNGSRKCSDKIYKDHNTYPLNISTSLSYRFGAMKVSISGEDRSQGDT